MTVGAVLVPLQLPRNPNAVDCDGESTPFQLSLVMVYGLAVCEVRAPQICVIRWPLAKVIVTVQLLVAVVAVLVTVTSPWNPPPHELVCR